MSEPSASKAGAVYERLRDDILSARLEPGTKLRIEWACAQYAAGNTPVREALNRLASEGLLVHREQRGFRVRPMDADDLAELTRTRCAIGTAALRLSIAHRDAAWEEALVLAHHRLQRTPRARAGSPLQTHPDWERAHREFHRALVARCGSRWLLRYCDELADHAWRYRQWALQTMHGRRRVGAEHEALLHAALAGDADRACALLEQHFQRTADAALRRVPVAAAGQGAERG